MFLLSLYQILNPDIVIELSARLVILVLCCVTRHFFVLVVHQVRLRKKAPSSLPKAKIPAPIIQAYRNIRVEIPDFSY